MLSHMRFLFSPVAMDTMGVFAQPGLRLLKEIGRRIKKVKGEERATTFPIQRMRLAVQRTNVACILGTLPAGKELKGIFLLQLKIFMTWGFLYLVF